MRIDILHFVLAFACNEKIYLLKGVIKDNILVKILVSYISVHFITKCFTSVREGDFMERFNNFISMIIEFLIISIMYMIILPFRILYNLGRRLASR